MSSAYHTQQKLIAYLNQKNDYEFFVGVRTNGALRWEQVYDMEGNELIGLKARRFPIAGLESWLVAYARTGELVDGEDLFGPLPDVITNNMLHSAVAIPAFTLGDLQHGRKLVEITISPSPTHPKDSRYYSTSLTNKSGQRVKCLVFGAFTCSGRKFKLSTVTGRPFSAIQFAEWYAVNSTGWLAPGATACDPSNYGGNCYWVYYFQTETNDFFHTGLEVSGNKGLLARWFGK